VALHDDQHGSGSDKQPPKKGNFIFESKQFAFPFTQVKVDSGKLKDLQKPLSVY